MKHIGIGAVILATTLAAGVSRAQEISFDSATVRIAEPRDPDAPPLSPDKRTFGGPGTGDPGHYYIANANMGELIRRAYGITADRLSAPCWIHSVKRCVDEWLYFEIAATMPATTTEEQFDAMLRNLLSTRFHLAVHHLTRMVPGYELVAEPGSVSPEHPVAPPGDENWRPNQRPFTGSQLVSLSADAERAKYRERSMPEFVASLESMVGLALGMDGEKAGKPKVTDKTGLIGRYSFTFGFSCRCAETVGYEFPGGLSNDPVGVALPTIFDAVREQLGLKLVKTADVPVDVIVVDHADGTPAN